MITKYITKKFELQDKKSDEHTLTVQIIEKNDKSILLELAPLCSYFENKIREMAQKEWLNKDITIAYNSNIRLGYFNFNAFIKLVYPDK